jgi:hypothetical protein
MARDGNDLARWAYIAIVVVSAFAMAVLFALFLSDRGSIKREANVRATQIQQQRYDVTFQNCLNQNDRHDETIIRLKTLLHQAVTNGQITEEVARRNVAYTSLLINSLVPKRNCKAVAQRAVQPRPTTNHGG